jgi:DNA (cytosine-5)-methyltransferase 1
VFIVGCRAGLDDFSWPEQRDEAELTIRSVLDKSPTEAKAISPQVKKCLQVWQAFIKAFPKSEELPSFPIWSMEFGATYPYETETPHAIGARRLAKYRGRHGIPLKSIALLSSAVPL